MKSTSNMWRKNDEEQEYQQMGGFGGKVRGVLPVQVEMPTVGKQFYFEQLLVSERDLTLKVCYKREDKGCYNKRSANKCGCF